MSAGIDDIKVDTIIRRFSNALFHEVFYDTRAATHASARTVSDDDIRYRSNISGTGIRELLRYGYMPPKEIVRPESALAAMQGILPKGVGDDGKATITPVGKVIKSMFPFYLGYKRLGGEKLETPRKVEDLTLHDLETALRDIRANASLIIKTSTTNTAPIWTGHRRCSRCGVRKRARSYGVLKRSCLASWSKKSRLLQRSPRTST